MLKYIFIIIFSIPNLALAAKKNVKVVQYQNYHLRKTKAIV